MKHMKMLSEIHAAGYSTRDVRDLVKEDVARIFHDFARERGWVTGDLDVPLAVAPAGYRADLFAALDRR